MATDHEPVTYAALRTLVEGLIEELAGKFGAIERRIAALEQRPALKHMGAHAEGRAYSEGALVTKGGSLWLATAATSEVPGNSRHWRLVVKQGKA